MIVDQSERHRRERGGEEREKRERLKTRSIGALSDEGGTNDWDGGWNE